MDKGAIAVGIAAGTPLPVAIELLGKGKKIAGFKQSTLIAVPIGAGLVVLGATNIIRSDGFGKRAAFAAGAAILIEAILIEALSRMKKQVPVLVAARTSSSGRSGSASWSPRSVAIQRGGGSEVVEIVES